MHNYIKNIEGKWKMEYAVSMPHMPLLHLRFTAAERDWLLRYQPTSHGGT